MHPIVYLGISIRPMPYLHTQCTYAYSLCTHCLLLTAIVYYIHAIDIRGYAYRYIGNRDTCIEYTPIHVCMSMHNHALYGGMHTTRPIVKLYPLYGQDTLGGIMALIHRKTGVYPQNQAVIHRFCELSTQARKPQIRFSRPIVSKWTYHPRQGVYGPHTEIGGYPTHALLRDYDACNEYTIDNTLYSVLLAHARAYSIGIDTRYPQYRIITRYSRYRIMFSPPVR